MRQQARGPMLAVAGTSQPATCSVEMASSTASFWPSRGPALNFFSSMFTASVSLTPAAVACGGGQGVEGARSRRGPGSDLHAVAGPARSTQPRSDGMPWCGHVPPPSQASRGTREEAARTLYPTK